MKLAVVLGTVSFLAGGGVVALALLPVRGGPRGRGAGPAPGGGEAATPTAAPPRPDDGPQATYTALPAEEGTPFSGTELELTGWDNRWRVRYRGPGGQFDRVAEDRPGAVRVLRLPADTNVRLWLRSRDYVYLLSLPRLHQTQIAVPGLRFKVDFRVGAPGTFVLPADHLCGPPQPALNLTAVVEPAPQFRAWLARQPASLLDPHE
jgi:heme/copper-type cytochrome/quinol oxidase subunit 2